MNLESALPHLPRPILLNLNLTENCQSKCKTCDYWKTKWEDYISSGRAGELLQEGKNLGIQYVRFAGGEPLLRRDFFDILARLRNQDYKKVTLATNGLLLSKYHKQINSSVITNVTVSLDGVGEVNDEIRGVKGHYDRVIKTLSYLKKKIKIVSTFTNKLIPNLEQIIAFCQENNYDYDINLPDTSMYFVSSKEVRKEIESLWPTKPEVYKGLEILKNKGILPNLFFSNASKFLNEHQFIFNHCILGFFEINIDSRGDVRTGCNVYEPVGNILDTSLEHIVNSNEYIKDARKMFNLECPLCTCGFRISALYNQPWFGINYIRKRLK